MQLTTLLTQLPRLQAVAVAPIITETELQQLESSVRSALENVASYRLVSATPGQVQTFFHLLETYAHDLDGQPVRERQRLACAALTLYQDLMPAAARA